MRILWFTNTPSNYSYGGSSYNGGGWISSLETEVNRLEHIELAISFLMDNQPSVVEVDNVTYFPISIKRMNPVKRIFGKFFNQSSIDEYGIIQCLNVIENFKPDLIHVFGSEGFFGLLAQYTDIPIIIHIQGLLNPCYNAYLPPFVSWKQYLFSQKNIQLFIKKLINNHYWKHQVEREKKILKCNKYVLGRTIFDYRIPLIYNKEIEYFHCDEILRPVFYENHVRHNPKDLVIVSTGSSPMYKGVDLILKTAKLLKEEMNIDFVWKVFGNINKQQIEKITKIRHSDVNVEYRGVVNAVGLCNELLGSSMYVHTSYIDNSPNSVCEAQILGVPCIATNVGGVSSLIDDGISGYLIPSNDPFQLCFLINKLYRDKELNDAIGNAGKMAAIKRHDKHKIITSLSNVYKQMYKRQNKE